MVGELVVLEREEVPRFLGLKLSPHQIDLREVLALAELRGGLPERLVVMGLQPARVEIESGKGAVAAGAIDIDDQGSLEADMRAGIGEAARLLRDPSTGGAYAALLAESARDPAGVGVRVRESLSTRLHALVATSVERAIDRGEIIFEGPPGRAFENQEVMKTIRG